MEDKVFTTDLYNPNSVQFKEMEKYVCDMVSTKFSRVQEHGEVCLWHGEYIDLAQYRVQKHGETCVTNRVPLDSGHTDWKENLFDGIFLL